MGTARASNRNEVRGAFTGLAGAHTISLVVLLATVPC
jgi:hypothetical protein